MRREKYPPERQCELWVHQSDGWQKVRSFDCNADQQERKRIWRDLQQEYPGRPYRITVDGVVVPGI